jgi:hypothetical protein
MERAHTKLIDAEIPIAIFNILGFQEFIAEKPASELKDLLRAVDNLSYVARTNPEMVASLMLSDTIVLCGMTGERELDASLILISLSNLLGVFAQKGIAVRGALTFGYMYIEAERSNMIGAALVRGCQLERAQDWIGAIVDASYERLFRSSLPSFMPEDLIRYYAPMKVGPRQEFECVGWTHRAKLTQEELRKLIFRGQTETQELYRKFRNTLDFLEYSRTKYPSAFAGKGGK